MEPVWHLNEGVHTRENVEGFFDDNSHHMRIMVLSHWSEQEMLSMNFCRPSVGVHILGNVVGFSCGIERHMYKEVFR